MIHQDWILNKIIITKLEPGVLDEIKFLLAPRPLWTFPNLFVSLNSFIIVFCNRVECCVCDCLRFASLWRPNSRGDSRVLGVHFSNVFWGLLFVFLTLAYFKNFLKVYYRSVFIESSKVVFWNCLRLLADASIKPGCLARRPLCHKVTTKWSLAAPFHHDLRYFRHRTNEYFSSMLFIRKNL